MTTETEYQEEVFEAPVPERDWEAEARAQGWKSPEELPEDFDGEAVDAKTFVQRGEQFVSLLKPKLDKLEKKLAYQEQVNNDLKNQYKRFEEAKQKEVDKLEKELKETRKRAIQDGDGDAFDEAEAQLKELDEYRQSQSSSNTTQSGNEEEVPEWAVEWQKENPWYGTDATLTGVADVYSEQLRKQNPYLSEKEFLDKVAEYVKTEMPHKFGGTRKTKGSPEVEGEGGRRTGGNNSQSNAKNYNSLPAEAKKECNRLIKEGIVKDKEQYAEVYFSQ